MAVSKHLPFMLAVLMGVTCFPSVALATEGQTEAETKFSEQLNTEEIKSDSVSGIPRLCDEEGDTLSIALGLIEAYKRDGVDARTYFVIDGQPTTEKKTIITAVRDVMSKVNNNVNRFTGNMYTLYYSSTTVKVDGLAKDERVIAVWITPRKDEADKVDVIMQDAKKVAKLARQHSQIPKEQIKFINSYIVDTTEYDTYSVEHRDEVGDIAWSAYGVFEEHKAVCAGYANAITLICEELGIPVIEVYSENHEWNMVFIDGEWLHLDTTWNDPIWKSKPTQSDIEKRKAKYTMLKDSEMGDHEKTIDDWKAIVNLKYPELSNIEKVEWDGIIKDIKDGATGGIVTKEDLAEVIARTDGMLKLEKNKEKYIQICNDTFDDVRDDKKVYVGYLLDRGVMSKSSDGHFSGNEIVTKNQLKLAESKLRETEYDINANSSENAVITYKDLKNILYIPDKQIISIDNSIIA